LAPAEKKEKLEMKNLNFDKKKKGLVFGSLGSP